MNRMSKEHLVALITNGESRLVDFKSQWYDIAVAEGKASFVKDVLAMANSTAKDLSGTILIGVSDPKEGTRIIGTTSRPSTDQLSQILSENTNPPVEIIIDQVDINGLIVDVIVIPWQPHPPFSATRNIAKILSRDTVYVRRGATTGILTLTEIEMMIRDKDAQLSGRITNTPLEFGFVEHVEWARSQTTIRVDNKTDVAISGIELVIDIVPVIDRSLCNRRTLLNKMTIKANESHEIKIDLRNLDFQPGSKKLDPMRFVCDGWMDITATLSYRDPSGYIRHKQDKLTVGN